MIYFTSDLHLFHNKEFLYAPRGFSNTYEAAETIIKNINDIVGVDDELYILGDLILNDNEAGRKLLSNIKCHNIHIILGNHDTDERIDIYNHLNNVVSASFGDRLKYGKYRFFLSHYPTITANNNDGKSPKDRVYNLCGHTHTKNRFVEFDRGIYAYHVELDAHNNKPVSIEEIINDIKNYFGVK